MDPNQKTTRGTRILRWTARVLSLVSIGFLLLFFFGEADFSQPLQLSPQEWVLVAFFPFGVVAGVVLGWWREGAGSLASIAALLGFYTADLVFTGTFPGGPFFLLFTLPGFLFGIIWLVERSEFE